MNACRRITRLVAMGAFLTFALGAQAAFGAATLADSYPESNTELVAGIEVDHPQIGQSFTAVAGTLDSVTFYLSRSLNSTGSAHALLYAHSGTFGVDGIPSGSPLATSAPVDVTTISYPGDPELITFHFDNTVRLTAGEKYVIVVRYSGIMANALWCGIDGSAPTHPGNAVFLYGSGPWAPDPSYDVSFYVYVTPPVSVYRLFRPSAGTHFYTADEAEKNNVIATLGGSYAFEGVSYTLNPWNNATPLYRFFRPSTGTHFYTADESEMLNIRNTLGGIYAFEGISYNVSSSDGGGTKPAVYRFFRPSSGTHFYTADPAERDNVIAHLPNIYTYEGPAFWVGQ